MKKKVVCILIALAVTAIFTPLLDQTKAQTQPTLTLVPSQTSVSQLNQKITIDLKISGVSNLWLWDGNITWNPTVLTLVTDSVVEGGFLTDVGGTLFQPIMTNITDGLLMVTDALMLQQGATGSGTLLSMQFQVIAKNASIPINFDLNALWNTPTNLQTGKGADIIPTSSNVKTTISFDEGGAPAANAGSNQAVTQGTQLTFDGSQSISTGSNPTYTWSFTDGTAKTLTGPTATYTFNTPGIYQVTLTVTDSNGHSDSNVTITVQSSTKPVAVIKIPSNATAQAGKPILFDASDSYEANNGTIKQYIWDMGDQRGVVKTQNSTLTYTYPSAATDITYTVTLTVTDATGLNGTAIATVKVFSGETSTIGTPPPNSASPTPAETDSGSSPTPDEATSISNANSETFNIPPVILAIVVVVTIVILGGSTFWLRKTVATPN